MVLDVIPPWGGEPAFTLLASPDHTHGAKQTKQSLAPATSPLARVRASLLAWLVALCADKQRASLVSICACHPCAWAMPENLWTREGGGLRGLGA